MKQLIVPYCKNLDFGVYAEVGVEEFSRRRNDYMSGTVSHLCWNHSGLAMGVVSHETRLRMEADTDGRGIWHDSYIELSFRPIEPERRYINLEVNPKRTIVMGFDSSRAGRVRPEEEYKPYPELPTETREAEGLWLARHLISFKLLGGVFGGPPEEARFHKFYANFYKRDGMTELPYYGMWNKIGSPTPDFYRSEFFGELRLVK